MQDKKVEKLILAKNHRPKNINSDSYKEFLKKTQELEQEIDLVLNI